MPAASQLYETTVDGNILMGSFSEISLEKIKNATGVNAASAFSNSNAKIILLDEPTASLDGEHAEKLMRYIRSCRATVIYTTHREEEAAFADRVIQM